MKSVKCWDQQKKSEQNTRLFYGRAAYRKNEPAAGGGAGWPSAQLQAVVLYNGLSLLFDPSVSENCLIELNVCVLCRAATTRVTRWSWTLWSTTSICCPVECSTRRPSPSLVQDTTALIISDFIPGIILLLRGAPLSSCLEAQWN